MKSRANPNAEISHCGHEDKEVADELNDAAVSESRSINPVFRSLGYPYINNSRIVSYFDEQNKRFYS